MNRVFDESSLESAQGSELELFSGRELRTRGFGEGISSGLTRRRGFASVGVQYRCSDCQRLELCQRGCPLRLHVEWHRGRRYSRF